MNCFFLPGDRWICIEIAASWITLDLIISDYWISLIDLIKLKHKTCKAFYVRYFDKTPHIRVRIQCKKANPLEEILWDIKVYLKDLIEMGCIWDFRIVTYKPEIQRYSPCLMAETEALFSVDSLLNAEIVSICRKHLNDKHRVLSALLLVDYYLDLFGYSLFQKYTMMKEISLSAKANYGFNQYNSKQFNSKFRKYKLDIVQCLSDTLDDSCMIQVRSAIKSRTEEFKQIVMNILRKAKENNREIPLISYIHMALNRLFLTRGQIYELFIYDFLARYYQGVLARKHLDTDSSQTKSI